MVNFETWYRSIPLITRIYLTMASLISFAVTFDLISPLQLYLNYTNVFKHYQIWRIFTNFLFFDRLSINFILHIYFLYFYSRRLEEHSFHRKSADFLYMILFGVVCMLIIAPMLQLPFMSHALVIMLLYVWSRRNPHEQLRLYGLFTVGAGYLSYILLLLGLMMGVNPTVDLVGIFVGHLYFFLKHVIVAEYGPQFDLLKTPQWMRWLLRQQEPTINDVIHAPYTQATAAAAPSSSSSSQAQPTTTTTTTTTTTAESSSNGNMESMQQQHLEQRDMINNRHHDDLSQYEHDDEEEEREQKTNEILQQQQQQQQQQQNELDREQLRQRRLKYLSSLGNNGGASSSNGNGSESSSHNSCKSE
jgi:Derlin-2/3